LGNHRRAIELHTKALTIARHIGNRECQGADLGNLGICHAALGDHMRAVDLHTQALTIARDIGNRQGEAAELGNLGNRHAALGDYRRAIDLHLKALTIDRDIGNREGEGIDLCNLGNRHAALGHYRRAIELHTKALTIARDIGDRYNEASTLSSLGASWLALADPHRAATLIDQAILIADETGDIEPAAEARSWLARTRLQLQEPAAALAATMAAREWPYPAEQPTLRLLEAVALLELHRTEEAVAAFTDTVASADAQLALAHRNIAALQARALALSGLAAVTGDATRAGQASEARGSADTLTTAAGVVADTDRLLALIAVHDRAGILADIRAAQHA
jgi:tetratricopeptide (TPR) repeat protein